MYIMSKTIYHLDASQKPIKEQLAEVDEAKNYPIEFDEDCPELSSAMMKAFKSVVVQRNRRRNA